MVGYYASWATGSGLPPSSIDASLLTHLNYAFADISSQNKLVLANPTTDRNNFKGLRSLKEANPHLVTLISVGGWDYSTNFSSAASTASSRATFAQSCVDFIVEHGFDGVDLEWEFPSASDRKNFTLLLREVRSKLDELSAKNGRPYYLTIAGAPNRSFLNNIEPQAVASLVDYIFLMGYDMHGPWDNYADLTAPLYPANEDSPHYANSVSEAVQLYLNAGVSASKIVLGMPLYGYRYSVYDGRDDGLFGSFSSAKSIGFDLIKKNYLSDSSFDQYYHSDARVPYLFDGETFISYDDEDSVAEKASYARSKGLAGIGAWELSHNKNFQLLKSARRALLNS